MLPIDVIYPIAAALCLVSFAIIKAGKRGWVFFLLFVALGLSAWVGTAVSQAITDETIIDSAIYTVRVKHYANGVTDQIIDVGNENYSVTKVLGRTVPEGTTVVLERRGGSVFCGLDLWFLKTQKSRVRVVPEVHKLKSPIMIIGGEKQEES